MEHLSVAIADDNQKILDILGEIISTDKELDLVGKAKNGEEMCQIIKDRQPDVVLLDLIMPKMDGLTVMEQVKQDSVGQQTSVFYCDHSGRPGKDYGRCLQQRRKLLRYETVQQRDAAGTDKIRKKNVQKFRQKRRGKHDRECAGGESGKPCDKHAP